MLLQPASSRPGLVRGTVVLLENSITVRITEQHKRMVAIPQQLYVPIHIMGVIYTSVSVLSCPSKMCSPMVSIEQWYSRRLTAPKTHTVKQVLHSPLTDSTTGTAIQFRAQTTTQIQSTKAKKCTQLLKIRTTNEDEVEKLAYQLNEEAERTERPIRRLSKVMYGSTCADMQVDVMGECLSSIKHVVGARRNRRQTAGEIARHTTQATGRPISHFTVARRLHGGGLFARRPVRCVPLTPAHRRRLSLWCREHRNWRDNEWGRVLFTDESRFSLSSDSHLKRAGKPQSSLEHH
ncbi:HTH_Tnp_Tc3_2 domain-containing protein [Trichonephila clavipes]|uniref:HTH_Tnp_Tc3_2 domain-containing protein n=1 Tax=Trichonephila clavipes TaxID=2585209 RepID=A0A8X6SAM3_TRICX|nr:HTH_Tnp_Tc3_2 domain-containing protein [Trichonephila clavipes]